MTNTRYVHPVHQVNDGIITSYMGVGIDLNNPTRDMINAKDIARGLGNTCRFGGQLQEFYSVAQHSVLVMMLAPKEYALEALLHDASEAYLGDVVKPLKVMLGKSYTDIEDKFTEIINLKYNLNAKDMAQIKKYDKQALELEYAYIHGQNEDLEAIFERIPRTGLRSSVLWTPSVAADTWLKFFELFRA